LPIKFKDDRIPTLHIQKMNDGMGDLQGNNLIQIDDGLQEGDIIFSPYDGLLTVPQITAQTGDLETFYLHPDASSPDEVFQKYTNMYFDMTSLKPLVNLDQAVKDNWNNLNIPIKKDQPIGTILTSYEGKSFKPNIKISWMTSGTEKSFNLATSEGKVIIIK
jgi:hypothetical protein